MGSLALINQPFSLSYDWACMGNLMKGWTVVASIEEENTGSRIGSVILHLIESAIVGVVVALLVSWAAVQRIDAQMAMTQVNDKEQEQRLRSLETQSTQHSTQIINIQQKLADIMQQQVDIARRQEEAMRILNDRFHDMESGVAIGKRK